MVAGSFTVGIITASDKGSRGEREDTSSQVIREVISRIGGQVEAYAIVPDERELLKEKLVEFSDTLCLDLVLTTGGTGFAPRDVTPEATRDVVERLVPGLAEAMRLESLKHTPQAMLSRAVAGIRGKTLIVNLPGSPKGVRECLEAILPALPHGIAILKGEAGECAREANR
ncbi:cytoplasmic protein [Clostridiales bacterium PH28_bin88]|nr:cytoplasmic protein [Clostridiales bacterium PH28_bin88]